MAGIADQGKGIREPAANQLNGGEGKRKEDGKSEDGPRVFSEACVRGLSPSPWLKNSEGFSRGSACAAASAPF